jgi:hypothetical protein
MAQEPKDVVRLEADQYKALVAKLPQIAVNNDTSPMQAGFQLGVQHVLKMLREGFTTGEVR